LPNNKEKTTYRSIDGFVRSPDDERRLNYAVTSVFKGDEGRLVLNYLKSISINAVSGPEIGANQLFHKEGMRFLVAIIEDRITKHNKENKSG
jgi:hypothetical protein